MLGYAAVSFAFGISAAGIGVTPFQATLLSLLNLTSAGQLASLEVIAAAGSYFSMALLEFVVNIRYMLMSASLSQHVSPDLPVGHRMGMSFGLSDEIFALSAMYPEPLEPVYTYGLMACAIPGWTLGTLGGAVLGQVLPARLTSALGLAIYGMFLAIIIPETRKKKSVFFAVTGAMACMIVLTYVPFLTGIPSHYRLIIVTLLVGFLCAVIAPVKDEEDGENA